MAELRSIRCSDHAATEALQAVRLTEQTLAGWWAPTLDALLAGPQPTPTDDQ
jgi:hypothetical protein